MSLHLGRVVVNEPTSWASISTSGSGIQVTVTGSYQAASLADGLVRRDQILGLANDRDVAVIPVIMDGEPRVSGYYRVLNTSCETDEFVRQKGNLYDFQIVLQPVMGFSQPIFESILNDALLTNSVGAVIGDHAPFHAYPALTTEYAMGLILGGYATSTRSSADGNMSVWCKAAGDPVPMTTYARFYVPPSSFYVGAAMIEQGSPLQPVVGSFPVADLVNWRLSNGMVRVTPNATPGKLDVAHWKGAAWAAAKTYKISEDIRGLINGFTAVTVLRNSVEECIVRLSCTTASGLGVVFIDIALRRGDRTARLYLTTQPPGGTPHWSIFRDTVEAATAITFGAVTLGGIRASVNDADGNRYVLLSYQTGSPTSDLVNGGITQTAAPYLMDFCIGSEIGGSGAAAIDTAVVLARQYVAAQTEEMRVVAR